jgi:DNA modification methylase
MEPKTLRLDVEYLPLSAIKPNPHNARTRGQKQTSQIAASMEKFGVTNPVLIDENNVIIAGHGRLAAAKQLKLDTLPTIKLSHLTDMQKRALMLADNKIALNAGWNEELLRIELAELLVADLDFDVGITGFDTAEIDLMLSEPQKADPADEQIEPDDGPPVSRLGDVWLLGPHRLHCGDALDADAYRCVMAGEVAQMVVSDVPYNVKIDGHVSGLGKVRHEEFKMASGEMSPAEYETFLRTTIAYMAEVAMDGAIIELFIDWRHLLEMLHASESILGKPINLCVWNKTNGGMGSLYRSKHELIVVLKKGTAPHINNVELGRYGRYRTNVWDYAGVNSFRRGRQEDLEDHPTVKPVAMIADAIRDCSRRNGIVLDPFGGSGTLILAAERTGRRARVIELDPKYVDVAIKRWLKVTKLPAILEETGERFEQVAAGRSAHQGIARDEVGPTRAKEEG